MTAPRPKVHALEDDDYASMSLFGRPLHLHKSSPDAEEATRGGSYWQGAPWLTQVLEAERQGIGD